jgi:hypothetical protein
MLLECVLCSGSQAREQPLVSVYHLYSFNSDNILMWICEVYGYKGCCVQLAVYVYYAWDIVLTLSLTCYLI